MVDTHFSDHHVRTDRRRTEREQSRARNLTVQARRFTHYCGLLRQIQSRQHVGKPTGVQEGQARGLAVMLNRNFTDDLMTCNQMATTTVTVA